MRPNVEDDDEGIIIPPAPVDSSTQNTTRTKEHVNLTSSGTDSKIVNLNHNDNELDNNSMSYHVIRKATTLSESLNSTHNIGPPELKVPLSNNIEPTGGTNCGKNLSMPSPVDTPRRNSDGFESSNGFLSRPNHLNVTPTASEANIEVLHNSQSSKSDCIFIQSPSRTRYNSLQNHEALRSASPTPNLEIPLIYSPLFVGKRKQTRKASLASASPNRHQSTTVAHHPSIIQQKQTKHHSIPCITQVLPRGQLADHAQRWKFQSLLAGSHRQSIHILDLSHLTISPKSLKYGVTPKVAETVTDFRFNSVGRHELPYFLDLVATLFPNLEHFTLLEDGSKESCDEMVNERIDKENKNVQDDSQSQVQVYSADLEEDDENDPECGVSTKSIQSIPVVMSLSDCNVPDLTFQLVERESERMQRLYILYRLPDLVSINKKNVTDKERMLARPMTPSGHKVRRQEWLTQAMATNDGTRTFGDEQMLSESYYNDMKYVENSRQSLSSIREDRHQHDDFYSPNATVNPRASYNTVTEAIERELSTANFDSSFSSASEPFTSSSKFDIPSSSTGSSTSGNAVIRVSNDNIAPLPSQSFTEMSCAKESPGRSIGIGSQQSMTSPNRSQNLGMFPHTNRSIVRTPKRNSSTAYNSPRSTKCITPKHNTTTNNLNSPASKKSCNYQNMVSSTNQAQNTNNANSSRDHNTTTTRSLPLKSSNFCTTKSNLESFLAKDKASNHEPNPIPVPSEVTDVAIAGHLLSKCNLGTHEMEKENAFFTEAASPDFNFSQLSPYDTGDSNSRKKVRNIRRREKKERKAMPLVGSMVRVKFKKDKKTFLPPTSPASTMRDFPAPRNNSKKKRLASVIDQMEDEEDDDDDNDDDDDEESAEQPEILAYDSIASTED